MDLPARLARLPRDRRDPRLIVAAGRASRLLGLAGVRGLPDGAGLLIPRCRSVHTLGMRFRLDLVWLDGDGRVVQVDANVGPWRLRSCRVAAAVIEVPARGAA